MSKRTHFIYIVLISLVLIGWFFDQQRLGSEPTTPAISASTEHVVGNNAEFLSTNAEKLEPEPTTIATAATPGPVIDNQAALELEPTPDVAALLQQQVTDYTTQFYDEDYDTDWSYTAVQQIKDLFALHAKELESFNVVAIECKSSVCQIKTHIEGHHFMGLMHLQKVLVTQDWYGTNSETTMTTKNDGEPHEVYISLDR